jgi:predicted anti-sigma-YlaC factor YlaD
MTSNVPFDSACKSFEEDLVLYYYGETSYAERRPIEQHLSGCQSCRRFVDDLRRLLPQMARSEEFPQSFWDAYYHETVAKLAQQRERKYGWRNLWSPMKVWMLPAFGTVAIAVLAIGLVLGKGNLPSFTDTSPKNFPQESLSDAKQLEFFESMDMLESLSKLEEQDDQKAEPNTNQSSSLRFVAANA